MQNFPSNARVFLVGGAVRDAVMGSVPKDTDYVVVGTTPAEMLAHGFTQVGADFPVFLRDGSEYALARTERRTGKLHTSFAVDASPDITLEEDLSRRDFTINAMARPLLSDGTLGDLVDPYGGVADVQARTLRHVSDAFVEDPLRVLRAARFAARFNFKIAPETRELMRTMVDRGDLDHLTPERVLQELRSALRTERPSTFLRVLRECGALRVILPEVDRLYGVPQHRLWHPEVDTGVHTEMVIDMAARLAPGDDEIVFAALVHDLGKGLTPPSEWPSHRGHEQTGLEPVTVVCDRLKVPTSFRRLAAAACRYHLNVHRIDELQAKTLRDMLHNMGALRDPAFGCRVALVCEADKRGRLGKTEERYPQRDKFVRAMAAARGVHARDLPEVINGTVTGPRIGEAHRRAQIAAIKRELHVALPKMPKKGGKK